ncbi:hypothetical protein HU200_006115 [Digitaria exilis]|uniref:Uncharacterized protein n=1 Tax=Digitaria exilis TaxID=1010633 RepID=A0A835FT48_9POAL|nr:hypothetical protein HU200_006115 [Digitaria exilis]
MTPFLPSPSNHGRTGEDCARPARRPPALATSTQRAKRPWAGLLSSPTSTGPAATATAYPHQGAPSPLRHRAVSGLHARSTPASPKTRITSSRPAPGWRLSGTACFRVGSPSPQRSEQPKLSACALLADIAPRSAHTDAIGLLWTLWKARDEKVFDDVQQDDRAIARQLQAHVDLWTCRAPRRLDLEPLKLWCQTVVNID